MGSPSTAPPTPGQKRSPGGSGTARATPRSAALKELRAEQQLVVALRIRPINETELEEGAGIIAHRVGDQMVVLMDPAEDPDDILRAHRSREKTFIFDMVFDPAASQKEVYVRTTKNLIEGVISGYNATVFAYGPTGAGKTYTMLGLDAEPGIYVRTLHDLFSAIEATSGDVAYSVSMSYLEIYNEVIRDLLNPSSGFLELREDSKGSIQIAGITEVSTTNAQEIMELLTKGNKERTQEPTAANRTSSRSHAVLQVTVKQTSRAKDASAEVRVGRLFMVDLAGSERAAQTQNRGKRMKEGAHINRSLLALGNCINALSEKGGSRAQYVNFRDSKLTRLLKDSLGGNSRTVMIAHISPAGAHFEESQMTLIYAYRAKNIKTRVKRNLLNVSYHIAQYTSIISDLRQEIERLKAKVENQEEERNLLGSGAKDVQIREETHQDSEESSRREMHKLRMQLIGAFKDQMDMRRSLMELENTNMELHIDTSRHLLTITDWEREKAHQACRYSKHNVSERDDEATEEKEEEEEEEGESREDSPEPHEVAVAREEINLLLAEQRKTAALKADLEQRLADAKKKASQMEKLLPQRITSEDQREVLRLLCRAHELEVGSTELQASAAYKDSLLCQKDFLLQQHQQHRRLCEEIIQQQRSLLTDHGIPVPPPLGKLYRLYSRESEEGTLNRLLAFHSLMSSIIQDRCVLDRALQVERNKEENRKGSLDHKKESSGVPKFELPNIVVESDRDSGRSSENTPARKKGSWEWNRSPTLLHFLRSPLHQPKVPGVSSSKLRSPISRNSGRKKSNGDALGSPLSREALKEIADGTKRIALVAASRRSQARDRHPSSEVSSLQYLEDELLELNYLQPTFAPEHYSKDTESVDSVPNPKPRKGPEKERGWKKFWGKRTGKKRSRSLEPTSPTGSRVKHRSPSSHTDHASESRPAETKLSQSLDVVSGNMTHLLSAAAKIKLPTGQQTEENPLQVLAVGGTAPSTVQQSNSGEARGQVLQKRVKGRPFSREGAAQERPEEEPLAGSLSGKRLRRPSSSPGQEVRRGSRAGAGRGGEPPTPEGEGDQPPRARPSVRNGDRRASRGCAPASHLDASGGGGDRGARSRPPHPRGSRSPLRGMPGRPTGHSPEGSPLGPHAAAAGRPGNVRCARTERARSDGRGQKLLRTGMARSLDRAF
uniref:kinesin-like protein KIF19 n=1 Tax=Euleptes europaea TaxID=460621 RepID=UPI0025419964|nr:kinesin-like protein KIF19 [Euleptes europaea]